MNQIVKGLASVEVIAEDFFVCGFGDTCDEALANHLQNFLSRCSSVTFIGNPEKTKLLSICRSLPL